MNSYLYINSNSSLKEPSSVNGINHTVELNIENFNISKNNPIKMRDQISLYFIELFPFIRRRLNISNNGLVALGYMKFF